MQKTIMAALVVILSGCAQVPTDKPLYQSSREKVEQLPDRKAELRIAQSAETLCQANNPSPPGWMELSNKVVKIIVTPERKTQMEKGNYYSTEFQEHLAEWLQTKFAEALGRQFVVHSLLFSEITSVENEILTSGGKLKGTTYWVDQIKGTHPDYLLVFKPIFRELDDRRNENTDSMSTQFELHLNPSLVNMNTGQASGDFGITKKMAPLTVTCHRYGGGPWKDCSPADPRHNLDLIREKMYENHMDLLINALQNRFPPTAKVAALGEQTVTLEPGSAGLIGERQTMVLYKMDRQSGIQAVAAAEVVPAGSNAQGSLCWYNNKVANDLRDEAVSKGTINGYDRSLLAVSAGASRGDNP